jgi:type I restriction enzyme S subunit
VEEKTISPSPVSRRFKPYPSYKDSGVEWLGEIPSHWDIKRLKYLASASNKRSSDKTSEFPFLGLEHIESGTGKLILGAEDIDNRRQETEGTGSLFRSRDVLFGKLRPYLAKVFLPDCNGRCSTELLVLRSTGEIYPRFLKYQLLNPGLIAWINAMTYGTKMPRANAGQITGERIALGPAIEQRAIAVFLDRETEKIDALIAKKERLIELLQKKRTALITQAVTKGLDPNVPMKDSGIEWLDKIPAHWECLSLSRVSLDRCDGPFGSGLKSEHYSESGVRVVRLQNIGSAEFCDVDKAYISEAYGSQLGDHNVLPEDLLIAGLGDDAHPVGRACVAPEYIVPAMVKADCFRFRLDVRMLHARFAAYQLSATATATAAAFSTGATRSRLNLTAMATRKVAIPPLGEQDAIVGFLDRQCDENCAIIAKIREAIDRLKEFRAAIISSAVTGKIDVRALA